MDRQLKLSRKWLYTRLVLIRETRNGDVDILRHSYSNTVINRHMIYMYLLYTYRKLVWSLFGDVRGRGDIERDLERHEENWSPENITGKR